MERRVRDAIETARTYTARNRRDDALRVLLDAEQLAPEQIRHHTISRQLVLSWIRNTVARAAFHSSSTPGASA